VSTIEQNLQLNLKQKQRKIGKGERVFKQKIKIKKIRLFFQASRCEMKTILLLRTPNCNCKYNENARENIRIKLLGPSS
jgi:GTP cyclohydrolase II